MNRMNRIVVAMALVLAACAEGRWAQVGKTEAQVAEDWDVCKQEVLSGQEHAKDTLAGGVNLSGCMQSKGYRYREAGASIESAASAEPRSTEPGRRAAPPPPGSFPMGPSPRGRY
ncbi:MAG: exported protein of unknown function [Nitrospira sp.]|nr:MAG: exported protein of unknown function [Nitrospira sp.]